MCCYQIPTATASADTTAAFDVRESLLQPCPGDLRSCHSLPRNLASQASHRTAALNCYCCSQPQSASVATLATAAIAAIAKSCQSPSSLCLMSQVAAVYLQVSLGHGEPPSLTPELRGMTHGAAGGTYFDPSFIPLSSLANGYYE